MRTFNSILIIATLIVIALFLGCSNSENRSTQQQEKVLEVKEVQLDLLESDPPQLSIRASGTVRTGGWKDPTLVQHIYVTAPSDGIYGFDFVAVPPGPDEVVPQVITPIEATFILKDIPEGLKGIKIHAESNDKVELLE